MATRTLLMFKDQRTARAVFSSAEHDKHSRLYVMQMRTTTPCGNEVVYGWGWDPREVLAKYGLGKSWTAVYWRWDAPDELRAVLAPYIREVAVA